MNENNFSKNHYRVKSAKNWLMSLTVAALLNGGLVFALENKLPDAATILDRYIEVTGGKAAYEKMYNSVSRERIEHVGMDFEDKATTYKTMPNKQYTIIESEALGKTQQGCDGNIVWYWPEQVEPMVETGNALKAYLISYAFDRIVHWRQYYNKAELVGEETVDGKLCYKIVMTPNVGQPQTCFFDRQSGLAVKYVTTRESSNMPPITMHIILSDYKEVDGLLIAHKRHRSFDMCGSKREMIFHVDSIKHNVTIASNQFDPPQEVLSRAIASTLIDGIKNAIPAPCNKETKKAPCKSGT